MRLFRGTRPAAYTTNPEHPDAGRIFIWAWNEWFERIVGDSGDVAFTPVAPSERELREWLQIQNISDLDELEGDFCEMVIDEFLEQTPLFPEAPEHSSEPPFEEQKPTEDVEHY